MLNLPTFIKAQEMGISLMEIDSNFLKLNTWIAFIAAVTFPHAIVMLRMFSMKRT
jgi:hypothetical protein